ncbi:hypothetical protein Tco_0428774 [Tanacetum coccineum]
MDDDTSSDDVIIEDVMLLYYRGVNSTPDRVLESPSPFPIPVVDSDAFFEGNSESLRRSYRRRRSSGKYHNHAIYSFTEDYPDFEDSRTDIKEMDKNKDKAGQNRAREWKEREKTSSTVPSDFIGPVRNPFYEPGQPMLSTAQVKPIINLGPIKKSDEMKF